jgi:hypothetical protein
LRRVNNVCLHAVKATFLPGPAGKEPFVKGLDPWVVTRGHEGAPRQHGAPMGAAAPDRAPATERPTGTMPRRYADQGGTLLPREHPQRGEFQPQRPSTHGPHPWDTRPPIIVFPPPRAGPAERLARIVQRG